MTPTVLAPAPPASDEELLQEYKRLEQLCAAEPDGPGRMTTLGWDLEYTSPTALTAFVDQILFRRVNDFAPDHDAPVILDCGANIGYVSLHYKRQFPGARITAFEPDPEFLPLLRRNLARNGADDVAIVPAAVWVEDGEASWVLEGRDGSRLSEPAPGQRSATVSTVDLRAYLNRDIDLLKLDIEGAEFDVVPRLAGSLERVRNAIVECHITEQSRYAGLAQVIATLTGAGFQISVNSSGPWRDLTRRHTVDPLHAEQYLTVYAWRGTRPPMSTEATFLPYVGLAHFRALQAEERLPHVERQSEDVSRTLAAMVQNRPGTTLHRIDTPFRRERGHCWYCTLPDYVPPGDSVDGVRAITIVLEDKRVLGPGHAAHDDVRLQGQGRYSHWGRHLYLSTSDNSDPNENGREYWIVVGG